jgi:hypothetical protein
MQSKKPAETGRKLREKFLWNFEFSPNYTALQPKRPTSHNLSPENLKSNNSFPLRERFSA